MKNSKGFSKIFLIVAIASICGLPLAIRSQNINSGGDDRTFDGARDTVYALTWHAASQRLAAGSHNGEVLVWNSADGRLLLKVLAAPGHSTKLSRSE